MSQRVVVRLVVALLLLSLATLFVAYERGTHWRKWSGQSVKVRALRKLEVWPARIQKCSEQRSVSLARRRVQKGAKPQGGFLAVLDCWDQQGESLRTLAQLQCLASHAGLRVVEPFLRENHFFFSEEVVMTRRDHLRLSDVSNVRLWNSETQQDFGFQPITRWTDFLRDAPNSLILVCVNYNSPTHIKAPQQGFDYREDCPEKCFEKFNGILSALSIYGEFRVVRNACANFVDYAGAVEESDLIKNILGRHDYRNVTVILNEFRSFFGLYGTPVLSYCGIDFLSSNATMLPSPGIMSNAQKYIADVFGKQKFVAVQVEMADLVTHSKKSITDCSENLKSLVHTLAKQYGTKHSFLAMDVSNWQTRGLEDARIVLDAVYSGFVSFSEWKSTFEKYTSRKEGAYVANLQRAIASQAECLVTLGAGGFQEQARSLYERRHPDPTKRCIYNACFKGN